MNEAEFIKLDMIDREHWFYRGKREIVRYWIDRYLSLSSNDLLIDAGCGTGTFLAEMAALCHVIGLDNHKQSIALTSSHIKRTGGAVLRTSLETIALPDSCATVVTALDVLEHLDNDAAAVHELTRLLRLDGLLIVTVPALPILWSDWDEALHHRRRYTRRQLLQLVQNPELEILRCTYFNTVLLPIIALIRLGRKLRSPILGEKRAEDEVPPRWLNSLLYHAMVKPACWPFLRPPVGVSLLAVMRRVGNEDTRS